MALSGKDSAYNATRVLSMGWEDPLKKEMQPTPIFLPGESHGQRSLAGHSPKGRRELDTTEQLILLLLPYNPAILLLGIYLKKMKTLI